MVLTTVVGSHIQNNMTSNLSIILTTSPAPWHPSTELTELSIRNKQELLGAAIKPVLACDGVPPYLTKDDKSNYLSYIKRLEKLDVAELVVSDKWVGHAGTLFNAYDLADELCSFCNIILATEDDDIVINPDSIDTNGILSALEAPNPIQCIRFVRCDPYVVRKGSGNYKVIGDLGVKYGVPLLANRGWATSTHFATKSFYEKRIIASLDYKGSTAGDGRGGVERVVWVKYRNECKKIGEMEAWKKWGICMYWRDDDKPQLDHRGVARKKWRESRVKTSLLQSKVTQ